MLGKINVKITLIITIAVCVIMYIYVTNEPFRGTPPEQGSTPCAPGYWCPVSSAGSTHHLCPGGTYGSSSGLSLPKCSGPCQAGCTCPEGSTSSCQVRCPAGHYCVEGTGGSTSQPIVCPQGYYCPVSSSAPIICPRGQYCPPGTSSIKEGR